ncbi:VOC family protein [Sandaracinus amylolyticus]|uniref:VOC family protein n=1 Tax=Sandaracinus amylolyticus TaxID=927083 RepID=UPI001F3262A9|nr:VOC family protein [Sandaracinus amylolyticus]UJR85618.1 Hypothetical protein I5071_76980 [Sandaracinus amylolyticus]
MSTTFWNTLAVEDLERSRAFYAAIGFEVRDMPGGAPGISVHAAGGMVCLFRREAFASMIPGDVCDARRAQEIIQSIATESRGGVDELVARVEKAGGRVLGKPGAQPWGYSGGFADPDGHVWAVLSFASA